MFNGKTQLVSTETTSKVHFQRSMNTKNDMKEEEMKICIGRFCTSQEGYRLPDGIGANLRANLFVSISSYGLLGCGDVSRHYGHVYTQHRAGLHSSNIDISSSWPSGLSLKG